MEAKTEQVAVWVTEKVHKGFDTVTKYVAKDGTKFDKERECLAHEKELDAIEKGKDLFDELNNLTPEQKSSILHLCFYAYDVSSIELVSWVCNHERIGDAFEWLRAKNHNLKFSYEMQEAIVGEKYLIASWTSFEHSDNPDYNGKIILFSDAIGALDSLKNALTQTT